MRPSPLCLQLNSDLMKKCDDTARALDQQRQETLKYKEEVVKLKEEMAVRRTHTAHIHSLVLV